MLPVAASVDDVGMRTTTKGQANVTTDIYDIDYARLTHGIHADADDRCPLCIADELRTRADARIADLHERRAYGSRMLGKFMTAAYARRDVAEAIEEGDVTVTYVERSVYGLSIRYRVNAR